MPPSSLLDRSMPHAPSSASALHAVSNELVALLCVPAEQTGPGKSFSTGAAAAPRSSPGCGKGKEHLLSSHVRTIGPSHSSSSLGVGLEQALQSPRSSEASLPMHSPMAGFAADGPGCVKIALSAMSDDDDHNAAGRGNGSRGFKSSLGYAGVTIGQASRRSSSTQDSKLTSSSAANTQGGSKRQGVLSMLKTTTLATAVGVILSPRPGKKQVAKQPQESVLARSATRHIHTLPPSPGCLLSQEGPLADGSSTRRSSAAYTVPVAVPSSKGASDDTRARRSAGDSLSQYGALGARALQGTAVSGGTGILSPPGSGDSPSIGAYRGATVLSHKE